jgi:hypothetical protein
LHALFCNLKQETVESFRTRAKMKSISALCLAYLLHVVTCSPVLSPATSDSSAADPGFANSTLIGTFGDGRGEIWESTTQYASNTTDLSADDEDEEDGIDPNDATHASKPPHLHRRWQDNEVAILAAGCKHPISHHIPHPEDCGAICEGFHINANSRIFLRRAQRRK